MTRSDIKWTLNFLDHRTPVGVFIGFCQKIIASWIVAHLFAAAIAATGDEFISPGAQVSSVMAYLKADKESLVIDNVKVLKTIIFASEGTEGTLEAYRLTITGLVKKSMFTDIYREILVRRPPDGGKSTVIFDTGAFQPECGAFNYQILDVWQGEIAPKKKVFMVKLRKDLATCVDMEAKRLEQEIWLDASGEPRELFRYDTLVEQGGDFGGNWSLVKSRFSSSAKTPKGTVLAPGSKVYGAIEQIAASNSKKPVKVKAQLTVVDTGGVLSILP